MYSCPMRTIYRLLIIPDHILLQPVFIKTWECMGLLAYQLVCSCTVLLPMRTKPGNKSGAVQIVKDFASD